MPLWNKKASRGSRGETQPDPNEGPPDSTRPAGLCPRCNKQSSFDLLGGAPVSYDYESFAVGRDGEHTPQHFEQVSVLKCRHCRQCVVVIERQRVGGVDYRSEDRKSGTITWDGFHWWPLPESAIEADVPESIQGVYREAVQCLAVRCPRAAAVMARRCLEAITVDQGENAGTLKNRLERLATRNVLHPSLVEWSNELRLVGNVGAHFDPISDVSQDDARQLLNFLRELLKYLYELPAALARRRNASP